MGNRHTPRLCRACTAPMAGQEETCWSCDAAYRSVDAAGDDGGHPAAMPAGARHVSLTTPRTGTRRFPKRHAMPPTRARRDARVDADG